LGEIKTPRRVVVIEPYFGGSHRAFLRTLERGLKAEFSWFTLPARKWKWRMRMAAPYFARKFAQEPGTLQEADLILCSPFLDVAAFKGLLPSSRSIPPICLYFHENQFAYPVRQEDPRDFHFALTNLTSALAADRVAFNSLYNLDTFLEGAKGVLKLNYDMEFTEDIEKIAAKAEVIHPPLEFADIDQVGPPQRHRPPLIVWNHRWEHDKDPELFFKTLFELKESGIPFRLAVFGESFKRVPEIFWRAKELLKEEICHFGFVESRQRYLKELSAGDIVVSTAKHEFYGMAVIEAVRAGCRPLLPRRLSYPELFEQAYLYDEGELFSRLRALLLGESLWRQSPRDLTERFSWESLAPRYRKWLNLPW